jgi:hypothetical protein
MIIYNVTVNIDDDIHDEWLQWMKTIHVPDVMKTGLFTESKICRILVNEEQGTSYSFQYTCYSMEDFEKYEKEHAPRLRQDVLNRYKDKFVAFRTLLEVIE